MGVPIKLIVFDLDGTLMGRDDDFHLYDEFAERLKRFKELHGAVWAICTGRSISSFRDTFHPMEMKGIRPDYVIFRHAYIWRKGRRGYVPKTSWNILTRYHLWSTRLYVKDALRQWCREITELSPNVRVIYERRSKFCVRFKSEQSAIAAEEILAKKANPYNHLKVFRNLTEVEVRMLPFTKGLAVTELAGRLGITRNGILTIGDGYSDLSMLDAEVAAHSGCPANAEVDVLSRVNELKGHIAPTRVLAGVIDVLDAYLDDSVCSDLPDWWTPSFERRGPRLKGRMMHPPRKKKHHMSNTKVTGWVVVLAGYVTLTVFASFGLVPFVSGLIMKPLVLLTRLVQSILDAVM